MKVTIERTYEKDTRWEAFNHADPNKGGIAPTWNHVLVPRAHHRLYATVELTNEELFVVQKTNSYFATLVEGDADYGNRDKRPKVSASAVVGFEGKQHGQRCLVFKHRDIQWVNRLEGLLKQGLEKWKKDIDAQANMFEKPKERDTYELR